MTRNNTSTNGQFRARIFASTLSMAAAASIAAGPASAQEAAEEDAYIKSLKACQAITDDSQRLTCYDAAVGTVVAASDEGQVRIIDGEDVKKTKRRLFGFSLPKLGLFGDDDKEEDLELLQSTITNVSISGRNTVFITIEDGNAVWRIPGAKKSLRARVGDKVEFKKAALGSYFVRINGQNGEKGRRVK
ncbi:hypothetical protein [Pontixanthobacter sp. CEM42]|uniref:hypothetical protein n=1 Tax=Pontixanthobacter sp. CEM42 TaxID=2792077 RepID=UPI001FD83B80|nr:hypothetical protein [Pontixanthobacter sp. CEM42]